MKTINTIGNVIGRELAMHLHSELKNAVAENGNRLNSDEVYNLVAGRPYYDQLFMIHLLTEESELNEYEGCLVFPTPDFRARERVMNYPLTKTAFHLGGIKYRYDGE